MLAVAGAFAFVLLYQALLLAYKTLRGIAGFNIAVFAAATLGDLETIRTIIAEHEPLKIGAMGTSAKVVEYNFLYF